MLELIEAHMMSVLAYMVFWDSSQLEYVSVMRELYGSKIEMKEYNLFPTLELSCLAGHTGRTYSTTSLLRIVSMPATLQLLQFPTSDVALHKRNNLQTRQG